MIIEMPQDALSLWRKKALDRFLELGFPKSKQDGFHYLSLSTLEKVWPKSAPVSTLSKETIASALLSEHHLVFVDGRFDPSLSSIPAGLICLPLDAALKSYGLFLQNRWTKSYKEEKDPFFALNGAEQNGGAFIYAPPKLQLTAPLHILHVSTGSSLASPRLQMTLGKEATLSLIQTTLVLGDAPFTNGALDIAMEAAAQLKLLDTQLLPANATSFYAIRATLKRDAQVELFHASNGAKTARLSVVCTLAEENSAAHIKAVSLLSGERESHVNALVEHAAPSCLSRQHIKMALQGKSRSSFEGKIYVHPIAQKTEAYQLNNQLLLSDEATANARPNLEIFADDVKASHGATFAQLRDEALFYLRSRGLNKQAAKALLVEGFCRELIDLVQEPSLRGALLAEMKRIL